MNNSGPIFQSIYLQLIYATFVALLFIANTYAEKPNNSNWNQHIQDRMLHKPKDMMSFLRPLRRLDLSEQQRLEITTVLSNHRESTKEQRKRLQTLKTDLIKLIPNFNDTNAQGLSLRMGEIVSGLEYAKIAVRASIYNTLTPAQKEKLVVMTVFSTD